MNNLTQFFATTPKGIETLVVDELKAIGAQEVTPNRSGASFYGDLEIAYKACLWLRTANRVLMPIAKFESNDPDSLYEAIKNIDWSLHLSPENTLAIDFNSSKSNITHSHFGALKVKDAIVDQFRERYSTRPSVEVESPDVQVNVYLLNNIATVSIDLSGDSLHKRGYRAPHVEAPLKENLAAAILMRSGWPAIAENGGGLIDPMCGSGTIPIEAALMAANVAPGLLRDYFGFLKWKGHNPTIWQKVLEEAENMESEGLSKIPFIVGYDSNPKAIAGAIQSAEKVGLITKIHFEKKDLANCIPHPQMHQPGLIFVNPPYGIRLGEEDKLSHLYASLGQQFKNHFPGWKATVLMGNTNLARNLKLSASKKHSFFNGAIPCTLFSYEIHNKLSDTDQKTEVSFTKPIKSEGKSRHDSMFSNRVLKNIKKLNPWIKQNNIHCYRAYDKDIPEYAVSVDIYENHIHVQEYKPPDSIDQKIAKDRLNHVMEELPGLFDLPKKNIHLKIRQKQKGEGQYQKRQSSEIFYEVEENDCRFLVNLSDYLDTGLFLDHRLTREMIGQISKGGRFLNLFSYTGTATIYAAKGGAKSTTSVDASKQYQSWARKNLALNGFSETNHKFVQSDCLEWLQQHHETYDLIFLDPPTFSNSKNRDSIFEIQKDHVSLINQVVSLLSQNGQLVFSNNFRKFKMDYAALKHLLIEDITPKTIPPDFQRNPKIHGCWIIKKQ